MYKLDFKIAKLIENQTFAVNINSAVLFRNKGLGWALFLSGACFRLASFSREYGNTVHAIKRLKIRLLVHSYVVTVY